MRLNLNLSSRPFTNHRLFWLAVALIFSMSAVLVFWVSAERTRVHAQADQVSTAIRDLDEKFKSAVDQEKQRREDAAKNVLGPADGQQLAAARQLLSRRSFSWNRMITDLEKFVPKDARVSSIAVGEVFAGGDGAIALVEIKAIGKTPAQLTQMMENLNKSGGMFVVGQPSQEQTADSGEVPFSLTVTYKPSRGEEQ